MLKRHWFLLLVLLIEGSALMTVELAGAKLLAPFYGSSLYVWTAVLSITVLGLTLGYFVGGRIAKKPAGEIQLIIILSIAAFFVYCMPTTVAMLITATSHMWLLAGICTSAFLLLVPPVFCFGMIGPLTVRLMADKNETLGGVAGTVYFTSTSGGIAATFLVGFYLLPESGLIFTTRATAAALIMLPLIYGIKQFFVPAKAKVHLPVILPDSLEPTKAPPGTKLLPPLPQATVYLLAALEGSVVMAVELMAARMLAPFFGSSLPVWVSVIGITLLSLAAGYYTGGRLGDKYPRVETIFWVLMAVSACIVSMHFVSQHFTHVFLYTDLRIALVLTSLVLIAPPMLLLGMVPTLLIKNLTYNIETAGTMTGRVFAVSSGSGIAALPLLGFYVIPAFGLTLPSIITGLLVGIFPLIHLLIRRKYASLAILPLILISFSQRRTVPVSPGLKVLSYSEGLLGQVLVVDLLYDYSGKAINERILFVNRIGQTYISNSSDSSYWSYINYTRAIAATLPSGSKALVLGLGGGTSANMLHTLNFHVDAVELDQRIAEAAKSYFNLNPAIHVIVDDARHYLETTTQKYDLIFFDVFKGEQQPPHVLSLECFTRAKMLLNENGLMVVNFNGFLHGDAGKPGRSVHATMKAAGLHIAVLTTPGDESHRNSLFVASMQPGFYPFLRSFIGKPASSASPDTLLSDITPSEMKDAEIFIDDKPRLDRMNMKANNAWRIGYNAYYAPIFLRNGLPLFR